MKEASLYMVGIHNFKLFTSGSRDNYEAIIYGINFDDKDNMLEIEFKGKSFYRYMVRNLVGALIEVGRNKVEPIVIKEMLDNPENNKELSTAKANGLYLVNIEYFN